MAFLSGCPSKVDEYNINVEISDVDAVCHDSDGHVVNYQQVNSCSFNI